MSEGKLSKSELSEKDRLVEGLIKDLDEMRPFVLASKEQSAELRSMLRRMSSGLEELLRLPSISAAQYRLLAGLLSRLIDAEHGALLSSQAGRQLTDVDSDALCEHVEERRKMFDQAQHDVPLLHKMVARCSALMGREISGSDDIVTKGRALEMVLRAHQQDDRAMRSELNDLMELLGSSLRSMSEVLSEVGEDSAELAEAQQILAQELPEDPKAARELLQQARAGLRSAGDKMVAATAAIQNRMDEQLAKMSELNEQLKAAELQARNDPLTGLANRRRLAEFLRALDAEPVSFVMLDIDFFKKINDKYGHDAGDEVLTDLAEVLVDCVREGDMVARLGGEEFCVVFPGTALNVAAELAEKLRMAIDVHDFKTSAGSIPVSISLGVAERHSEEANSEWIKRADAALYQSKSGGRNRVTLSEGR
ncbi:MAG: diguanylate cyclase [Mariprofundales bacterium]|nr:diguanylate cyclase [Mariprofundales bacterium]